MHPGISIFRQGSKRMLSKLSGPIVTNSVVNTGAPHFHPLFLEKCVVKSVSPIDILPLTNLKYGGLQIAIMLNKRSNPFIPLLEYHKMVRKHSHIFSPPFHVKCFPTKQKGHRVHIDRLCLQFVVNKKEQVYKGGITNEIFVLTKVFNHKNK